MPKQDDCCLQILKVNIITAYGDSCCYQPCDWIADTYSCHFKDNTLYILPPKTKTVQHFTIYKNKLPPIVCDKIKISKHKQKRCWEKNIKSFQLELTLEYASVKYSTYNRVFAPDHINTNVYNLDKRHGHKATK